MAIKKRTAPEKEIAIAPKKLKKHEKNPHDKKRITRRKVRDWF